MKVVTVEEALASMQAKKNKKGKTVINRFNKRNFNMLMVALANDLEFTSKVAKVKGNDVHIEEVMVTKEFRKWCKKLVEKMGIDKTESEKILSSEFIIDNMDGLYEFFAEAIYLYMKAGNRFDFPSKDGFQGGMFIKDIPESVKVSDIRNPQTKETIGKYETTKKAHSQLKSKSSCPKYLSDKRKI